MKKEVILLLNGKYYPADKAAIKGGFIVAVDGGIKHTLKLAKTPSHILGDLDSYPLKNKKLAKLLKNKEIKVKTYAKEKDFLDAELALHFANKKLKPDVIHIIGGLGGEVDHQILNMLILSQQETPVVIWGKKQNIIYMTQKHKLTLKQKKQQNFSLIGLTVIEKVKYKGAYYKSEYKNLNIAEFSGQAARNNTTAKRTKISWNHGKVLIVISKKSKFKITKK